MNGRYWNPENSYRNLNIFYETIDTNRKLRDIAKKYKISSTRIKMLALNEAKRRAPNLYKDLSLYSQGPLLAELRRFKDQFLWGELND